VVDDETPVESVWQIRDRERAAGRAYGYAEWTAELERRRARLRPLGVPRMALKALAWFGYLTEASIATAPDAQLRRLPHIGKPTLAALRARIPHRNFTPPAWMHEE